MAAAAKPKKSGRGPTKASSARNLRRRARGLVKESQRIARRYRKRLHEESRVALGERTDDLSKALTQHADDLTLIEGLSDRLEDALEEHAQRFRKSVTRDYVESIVWAVGIALFIRAFFFEAFQIPTGSMIPTLHIGDHIFVNKFIYGVRIPWTHIRFFDWRTPERGEIVVFEYPGRGKERGSDFIKRVVAVAGDRVRLKDHQLFVNGEPVFTMPLSHDLPASTPQRELLAALRNTVVPQPWDALSCNESEEYDVCHCSLQYEQHAGYGAVSQHHAPSCHTSPDWPEEVSDCSPRRREDCLYFGERRRNPDWPEVVIPEDTIFCMGDNRDNSSDGRYWGVVPLENVKGKAFVIWWASDMSRLFSLVH